MEAYLSQLPYVLESIIFSQYFRIGFLIFSIFLTIAMLGMVRKHYFKLTMRGANFGFLLGMIFVIVVEVIIVIVALYGIKTLEVLSGKKNSAEVTSLTQQGIVRISRVLGSYTIGSPSASLTQLLEGLPQLSKTEEDRLRQIICR